MFPESVWYWREFEMVDERVLVIVYGLMDGSFKMLLRGIGMGCQTGYVVVDVRCVVDGGYEQPM
jgi:hypothetical protein